MGMYAIAWSSDNNITVENNIAIHVSHVDTKSCDEMMECDNDCYNCCHCATLLKTFFDNSFNLQTSNIFSHIASLNNLPALLYKPPC